MLFIQSYVFEPSTVVELCNSSFNCCYGCWEFRSVIANGCVQVCCKACYSVQCLQNTWITGQEYPVGIIGTCFWSTRIFRVLDLSTRSAKSKALSCSRRTWKPEMRSENEVLANRDLTCNSKCNNPYGKSTWNSVCEKHMCFSHMCSRAKICVYIVSKCKRKFFKQNLNSSHHFVV